MVCVTAPAADASSGQYTIFEAPTEMASGDPALRAATFDQIQSFGVSNVRVLLYWNSVVKKNNAKKRPAGFDPANPDDPGYDWSRYDGAMADAAARGIDVMVTLTGPVPRWATGNKKGHTYKPSRIEFAKFVEAAGRRYGGQVKTWSIWNEPNHPQFLTPQYRKKKPYSPKIYRPLYMAALQGLGASGNGSDTILAGETAPRGNANLVAPVTFAKIFFQGKKLDVDGWAHHPYTTKAGPFYKPSNPKDATIGVLSRLTRQLDRSSKHKRLPLYLTEFGIQSKPDPYVGVTEQRQAEYRSISERIAFRNPRVKAFSQYLMRDDQPRKGPKSVRYGGFESGLLQSDGDKKKVFEGFRLPLVADRRGSKVSLWGLIRPAGGATTATVQYRSGSWKDLATVNTDSRGYWSRSAKYKKGRSYRVVWTDSTGAVFTSPATRTYSAP